MRVFKCFGCESTLVPKVPAMVNFQENAVSEEMRKFQGSWRQLESESGNVGIPPDELDHDTRTIFSGTTFVVTQADGTVVIKGLFTLYPTENPKAVDWTDTFGADAGRTFPAIYSIDSDRLTFCAATEGGKRPTGFRPMSGQVLRILQRER